MELKNILLIMCIVLIYVPLVAISEHNLRERLSNVFDREKFIWINAVNYIGTHRLRIAQVGALLFPLTYAFLFSINFTRVAYNILIEKKDENRFASWLF